MVRLARSGRLGSALLAAAALTPIAMLHTPVHAASALPALVLDKTQTTVSGVRGFGMSRTEIDAAVKLQLEEIERRRALYLPGQAPIPAEGRTAIIVDDGIATGASVRAAIAALKRRHPGRVVVAAPVAVADTVRELRRQVDDVICLAAPERFGAVGYFYDDFHQLDDREVIETLGEFAKDREFETRETD